MRSSSDPSLDSGLCGTAYRVSAVALIASVAAWCILGTLTLAVEDALDEPVQRFAWTLLAMLTLAFLGVHLTCRVIRWLRRVVRNQEAILEALGALHQEPDDAPRATASPAENVLAFQLGRRVGRADRAPTLLPE